VSSPIRYGCCEEKKALYVLNDDVHKTTGHAVVQLVKAKRYNPEGCGFDSQWCHWNFSPS
jgi:hypothetical protein